MIHGGMAMVMIRWIIGFVMVGTLVNLDAKTCKMTDLLVHKNGYSHQFVFHSNCPLEYMQSEGSRENEIRIFIPTIVKDESIRRNIEKVNVSNDSSYYGIKMFVKDNGIECVINVNPNNLRPHTTPLELQKTTSITGNHGLVVKLHDTQALGEMEAKSGAKRITRFAYADLSKKPTIVVDCGHGGKDSGYCDKVSGLKEKHINKLIGDKVAALLKKKIIESV